MKKKNNEKKERKNDGDSGQPLQHNFFVNGKVDEFGKGEKQGIPWRLK